MTLYIKNMVCNRCKMVVQSILEKLNLHPIQVELGEIELEENDISFVKKQLKQELESFGFSLLDSEKSKKIEKVKNLITDLVQNKNNALDVTLSDFLSNEMNQDYSALSNLFSGIEGITIEKYYILQKIEKVKELLVYNELTLSEISLQLNYSSVSYLSNQFKKVTGLTPSHFKKLRTVKRKPLEEL
jgi:AraC-like DNA-binding protein